MLLNNRTALDEYRELYKNAVDAQKKKILICAGTGCVAGGSLDIYARLIELLKEKGVDCVVSLADEPHDADFHKGSIGVKRSGCHGFCEMGPLVRIEPGGLLYTKVKVSDCEEIVEKTIIGDEYIDRLAYKQNGVIYKQQEEIPFYKMQSRVVLEHCGHIDATSIKEYLAIGGYSAVEKALFDMTSKEILDEMLESNLRGRGGGGFPLGKKWVQVANQSEPIKYVVCNGDEGDPGAFMDRSVMEGDPHRLLEGMIIGGIATGAQNGYIYVRAEYPLAVSRLQNAIKEAEEFGLLGDNILGTDFSFHILLISSAGAFGGGEGSLLTA